MIEAASMHSPSQGSSGFKIGPSLERCVHSSRLKLVFAGATATLAFAKLASAQPNAPGKLFVRVTHSDPKHPANAADKLAVFTAPAWLSEQLPASLADFRKAGQPAAAPSFLPIPGPAQAAPSPLQPSK